MSVGLNSRSGAGSHRHLLSLLFLPSITVQTMAMVVDQPEAEDRALQFSTDPGTLRLLEIPVNLSTAQSVPLALQLPLLAFLNHLTKVVDFIHGRGESASSARSTFPEMTHSLQISFGCFAKTR